MIDLFMSLWKITKTACVAILLGGIILVNLELEMHYLDFFSPRNPNISVFWSQSVKIADNLRICVFKMCKTSLYF